MLSVRNKKVVKYRDEENKVSLVLYEFNCDTVSDLPQSEYYEGTEIAQGSIAWIIEAGEFYGYSSSGNWVKQGSSNSSAEEGE